MGALVTTHSVDKAESHHQDAGDASIIGDGLGWRRAGTQAVKKSMLITHK